MLDAFEHVYNIVKRFSFYVIFINLKMPRNQWDFLKIHNKIKMLNTTDIFQIKCKFNLKIHVFVKDREFSFFITIVLPPNRTFRKYETRLE